MPGKRKRKRLGQEARAAKRAAQAALLDTDQKVALQKQLNNRTLGLVLLSVDQPWCSSIFKPKTSISRPKDMEFRTWDISLVGLDKDAPKFCVLLSNSRCQKHVKEGDKYRSRTTCFRETSKKAAAETGDDTLLTMLKCEVAWQHAQDIIKKNGCGHGSVYPFNTIEGVVLFDGQADLEECKKHPWWPGFGKKGFRIVKVIRFPNPIHHVCGKVEGFPKRVAVSNWLGEAGTCKTEEEKINRGSTLFEEIKKQLQFFL